MINKNIFSVLISPRGQFTIPIIIRREWNLYKGSTVLFEVEKGKIIMRPEV